MKKLNSAVVKWAALLASLVLVVGSASMQACCVFWYHQPKVPQGMEKFKK